MNPHHSDALYQVSGWQHGHSLVTPHQLLPRERVSALV